MDYKEEGDKHIANLKAAINASFEGLAKTELPPSSGGDGQKSGPHQASQQSNATPSQDTQSTVRPGFPAQQPERNPSGVRLRQPVDWGETMVFQIGECVEPTWREHLRAGLSSFRAAARSLWSECLQGWRTPSGT
jgi:hypothetical protein